MSPELKRVRTGLNNIIALSEVAIDRKTASGSRVGLQDVIKFAKQQIKYIDLIQPA